MKPKRVKEKSWGLCECCLKRIPEYEDKERRESWFYCEECGHKTMELTGLGLGFIALKEGMRETKEVILSQFIERITEPLEVKIGEFSKEISVSELKELVQLIGDSDLQKKISRDFFYKVGTPILRTLVEEKKTELKKYVPEIDFKTSAVIFAYAYDEEEQEDRGEIIVHKSQKGTKEELVGQISPINYMWTVFGDAPIEFEKAEEGKWWKAIIILNEIPAIVLHSTDLKEETKIHIFIEDK